MVVGHAYILASVLLWHTNNLQGLVEVLKLDFLPWQLPTFLKPLDDGCWTGGESNGRKDKTSKFSFMCHYSLFKQMAVLILSLRSTCVCDSALTVQQRYTPAAAAHLAAPFWSSHFLMVRGRSAWTLLLYGLQMWQEDGLVRTNKAFIYLCSMTHFLH